MKDFEKLLKEKLAKDGISEDWMKKHLIVDTITKDDIDDLINNVAIEKRLHADDDRDEIINLIEGGENE
tara:strand:- start:299 stop:505 length:207 start_codon:yes stop_codon:yes gene_type:complete